MKNLLKESWEYIATPFKYTIIFCIGCAILILVGCSFFQWYPDDNEIEEAIEAVLKEETGLDVDLSPFSPEK